MESPEIDISDLYYREFRPHQISVSGKEINPVIFANVIYFGGTFETPDAPSTLDLRQSWADYSGSSSFVFMPTASIEQVHQLIKEKHLGNVVLTGYSQGAIRAVDLAALLQEQDDSIKIEGLILLEPVGMYQQNGLRLAINFALDSIVKTPLGIATNTEYIQRGIGVLKEFIPGTVPQPPASPTPKPSLREQIALMSRVDPHLQEVETPLVLIQGSKDIVSEHEKMVPREVEEEIDARQAYFKKLQQIRRSVGKKWSEIKFPKFEDLRENYLKEFVFPKSPFIRMLVPEKAGHHGLPIFRPESVAKASLYILGKWNKQNLKI